MGVFARSLLGGVLYGSACAALLAVIALLVGDPARNPWWLMLIGVVTCAAIFGGIPGAIIGTIVGLVRRTPQPKIQHTPPVDMWSLLVDRCADATRKVAAAATNEQLRQIADELKKELDDVRGIALLGRSLGAVDPQHPVYRRLEAAAREFTAFEQEFVRPDPDLESLAKKIPQLSG